MLPSHNETKGSLSFTTPLGLNTPAAAGRAGDRTRSLKQEEEADSRAYSAWPVEALTVARLWEKKTSKRGPGRSSVFRVSPRRAACGRRPKRSRQAAGSERRGGTSLEGA